MFLIGSQENWLSGHLFCRSLILKLCIKLGKVRNRDVDNLNQNSNSNKGDAIGVH